MTLPEYIAGTLTALANASRLASELEAKRARHIPPAPLYIKEPEWKKL